MMPPYDPNLDYMSLYLKKYQQNQGLLSTFTDLLGQRNSLLAEVLQAESVLSRFDSLKRFV